MELRKLFPRFVLATLALSILSVSAFAQTRPRVANGGDVNEVSCSPDEFAVLASAEPASKPAWEAKPRPVIDLAPAPSSSGSGFIRFEPLLMTVARHALTNHPAGGHVESGKQGGSLSYSPHTRDSLTGMGLTQNWGWRQLWARLGVYPMPGVSAWPGS